MNGRNSKPTLGVMVKIFELCRSNKTRFIVILRTIYNGYQVLGQKLSFYVVRKKSHCAILGNSVGSSLA